MGLIEEVLADIDKRIQLARALKTHHPHRAKDVIASVHADLDFVKTMYSLQRHTQAVILNDRRLLARGH